MINVQIFPNGPLSVNTYLLKKGSNGIIIDPGSDINKLLEQCKSLHLIIDKILLTHGHLDHIAGVAAVKKYYPSAQVVIHKDDAKMALALDLQATMLMMDRPEDYIIDIQLNNAELIKSTIGELKTIYIGGHSKGSICYVINNLIFSGDTLFNFAIGRTDLLGSTTYQELVTNINSHLIANYNDSTKVYPGHGPETTIGFEKNNNVMLKRRN